VIPESVCQIPTTAKAVSMNVTVVSPSAPGFLAIWPGTAAAQPNPLVSSLNYVPGDVVPNAVIVPLDGSGRVSVATVAATDVLFDVNGYFTDTPAAQVVNTPSGSISATTVQAAIDELGNEKLNLSGHGAGRVMVTATGLLSGVIYDSQNLLFGSSGLEVRDRAMKVTGTQGRTTVAVSPFGAYSNAPGMIFNLTSDGQVTITSAIAGAPRTVYVPVPAIPMQIFGTAVRLAGASVCYRVSNASSSLSNLSLQTEGTAGAVAAATGTYSSTTQTCIPLALSGATPPSVSGQMVLALDFNPAVNTHTATLGTIEITLDQI
jgi:hypothetical protein